MTPCAGNGGLSKHRRGSAKEVGDINGKHLVCSPAKILAVVGGASLVAYLGAAYALGAEEMKSVVALLRRRVAE